MIIREPPVFCFDNPRLLLPLVMGSRDKLSGLATSSDSTGRRRSRLGARRKMVAGRLFPESGLPRRAWREEEWVRRGLDPKGLRFWFCLFEGEGGDIRVILTKRSSRLSIHSVSLPGGKAEEGDKDDGETATREAKEEIGLDPSLVNVVTCLEPFLSKHSLRVVPVIGILIDKEAFEPIPNPAEVEGVFDAPLEMFIKDENKRAEYWEFLGEKYLVHYFDYVVENKKFLIWGLTAGILIRAASVVYQRPPAFLEQNPAFEVPRVVNEQTIIP